MMNILEAFYEVWYRVSNVRDRRAIAQFAWQCQDGWALSESQHHYFTRVVEREGVKLSQELERALFSDGVREHTEVVLRENPRIQAMIDEGEANIVNHYRREYKKAMEPLRDVQRKWERAGFAGSPLDWQPRSVRN